MGLLRLLVAGAAVAAGVNYITKKRPNGTSIADDLQAKAPEWKDKAQPYIDQLKDQFNKVADQGNTGNTQSYTQKFNNSAPDPDPGYSS